MTKLSKEEIDELNRQLKEKAHELKIIYNKLIEAGAVPLPDDFLDEIAGGCEPTLPPLFSQGPDEIR